MLFPSPPTPLPLAGEGSFKRRRATFTLTPALSAPLRFWRIADQAGLAWRHWDGEYVFHHALSNDTHRLSQTAGVVLLQLLEGGETEQGALAEACELDSEDIDVILSALVKIDFVAWR